MRWLSHVTLSSGGLQKRHGDCKFLFLVFAVFDLLTGRFGGYILNAGKVIILWEYIYIYIYIAFKAHCFLFCNLFPKIQTCDLRHIILRPTAVQWIGV